jgi:hypothetical protein
VAGVVEIGGLATEHFCSCADRPRVSWAFEEFGGWTLYGGSVSCHLVPEWVSGRGFFDTEAVGGPRGATEKRALSAGEATSSDEALSSGKALSSDETPKAILQTKRVEVE